MWEVRRQQYEQCMDLQLFYRDTEQVDNWMSKQEVTSQISKQQHLNSEKDYCGGILLGRSVLFFLILCFYCIGFPPQ